MGLSSAESPCQKDCLWAMLGGAGAQFQGPFRSNWAGLPQGTPRPQPRGLELSMGHLRLCPVPEAQVSVTPSGHVVLLTGPSQIGL